MGDLFLDTILLFSIGLAGWFAFSLLRIPVPDILGSIAAVAFLRLFFLPQLPPAPAFFSPLIQICLGLFIGSKITRDKILTLKALFKPALIIVVWVVVIALGGGALLAWLTSHTISPITGILSSSMGGLPEMTIIAMETDADVAAVVAMKTLRMILTVVLFPVVFEKWLSGSGQMAAAPVPGKEGFFPKLQAAFHDRYRALAELAGSGFTGEIRKYINPVKYGLLSLGISALGGSIFRYLGVPAGAMIGGMFFVAIASVTGAPIKSVPMNVITFLRVGLGVVIADGISRETFSVFTSSTFLLAVFVNVMIVFLSFALVTYIIHKVTGWDVPTCYLSASPAGLTIMSTLALKYDKDVFTISMLHLCRLIAIKAILPFILMRML